ncbi:granulysin isoform X1 [Caretta caretta]|uniref:granulysin isoform X1 n=1 Tax=Caretta caretta TaxID=8467 RepID=UPI003F4C64E2
MPLVPGRAGGAQGPRLLSLPRLQSKAGNVLSSFGASETPQITVKGGAKARAGGSDSDGGGHIAGSVLSALTWPLSSCSSGWAQGWRIQEQALSPKCTICTRILKKLKSMVGDDPDEDSITKAEEKLCRAVGWSLRPLCRSVMKKFKSKIMQALQDGLEPKEICTSLRMCRASPPTQVQRLRLDLPRQAAAGSEGAPGPAHHLSGRRCLPAAGGAHPRRGQLWHQHLGMAMRPGLVHPHPQWAAPPLAPGMPPLLPPSSDSALRCVTAGMAALTPLTFASPPRFGQ